MVAQGRLDGIGLVEVSQRGRGAVSVEVVNSIRVDACIAYRRQHGPARPVHIGCSHVAGVGAHTEPGEFGIYFRTARFGMLKLFKHHDARALAQNKAITVAIPGPRCSLRVIIAGAQGAHGGKAANTQGETVDSAPPASITSASPYSIMRPAWPIQCKPVVQAVTTEILGPLKPKRMDT